MIGRWGSAETMDRVCIAVCVLIFSIAAGIHTSRRVYFVNFLMVTVITFGHRRFTGVMDFLVVLTAVAGTVWLCFEALRHLAGRGEAWSRAGEAA